MQSRPRPLSKLPPRPPASFGAGKQWQPSQQPYLLPPAAELSSIRAASPLHFLAEAAVADAHANEQAALAANAVALTPLPITELLPMTKRQRLPPITTPPPQPYTRAASPTAPERRLPPPPPPAAASGNALPPAAALGRNGFSTPVVFQGIPAPHGDGFPPVTPPSHPSHGFITCYGNSSSYNSRQQQQQQQPEAASPLAHWHQPPPQPPPAVTAANPGPQSGPASLPRFSDLPRNADTRNHSGAFHGTTAVLNASAASAAAATAPPRFSRDWLGWALRADPAAAARSAAAAAAAAAAGRSAGGGAEYGNGGGGADSGARAPEEAEAVAEVQYQEDELGMSYGYEHYDNNVGGQHEYGALGGGLYGNGGGGGGGGNRTESGELFLLPPGARGASAAEEARPAVGPYAYAAAAMGNGIGSSRGNGGGAAAGIGFASAVTPPPPPPQNGARERGKRVARPNSLFAAYVGEQQQQQQPQSARLKQQRRPQQLQQRQQRLPAQRRQQQQQQRQQRQQQHTKQDPTKQDPAASPFEPFAQNQSQLAPPDFGLWLEGAEAGPAEGELERGGERADGGADGGGEYADGSGEREGSIGVDAEIQEPAMAEEGEAAAILALTTEAAAEEGDARRGGGRSEVEGDGGGGGGAAAAVAAVAAVADQPLPRTKRGRKVDRASAEAATKRAREVRLMHQSAALEPFLPYPVTAAAAAAAGGGGGGGGDGSGGGEMAATRDLTFDRHMGLTIAATAAMEGDDGGGAAAAIEYGGGQMYDIEGNGAGGAFAGAAGVAGGDTSAAGLLALPPALPPVAYGGSGGVAGPLERSCFECGAKTTKCWMTHKQYPSERTCKACYKRFLRHSHYGRVAPLPLCVTEEEEAAGAMAAAAAAAEGQQQQLVVAAAAAAQGDEDAGGGDGGGGGGDARRCYECGTTRTGGNSWKRHKLMTGEFTCNACYKRFMYKSHGSYERQTPLVMYRR